MLSLKVSPRLSRVRAVHLLARGSPKLHVVNDSIVSRLEDGRFSAKKPIVRADMRGDTQFRVGAAGGTIGERWTPSSKSGSRFSRCWGLVSLGTREEAGVVDDLPRASVLGQDTARHCRLPGESRAHLPLPYLVSAGMMTCRTSCSVRSSVRAQSRLPRLAGG